MTGLDEDAFRRRLEERRARLLADRETAREGARPVELDPARMGRVSRMDAMLSQATAVELERRREQDLQRIDRALARIEAGEYGLCQACEEEIGARRLEVDPAATLCIECAQRRER